MININITDIPVCFQNTYPSATWRYNLIRLQTARGQRLFIWPGTCTGQPRSQHGFGSHSRTTPAQVSTALAAIPGRDRVRTEPHAFHHTDHRKARTHDPKHTPSQSHTGGLSKSPASKISCSRQQTLFPGGAQAGRHTAGTCPVPQADWPCREATLTLIPAVTTASQTSSCHESSQISDLKSTSEAEH